MKIIRQWAKIAVGLVIMTLPSFNQANPNYPNFSIEKSTLYMPVVNIDGVYGADNVEVVFDFVTQTFVLKNIQFVSPDFQPVNEIELEGSTELNDTSADAQKLSAIGAHRPVKAEINPAGDQDWYSFQAVAGHTYIVELFDVANNLALVQEGECGSYRYGGIWLAVFDSSLLQVARQCQPVGAQNVHTVTQFTPGISGTFYIQVAAHSKQVLGGYSLRILPKHNEPNTFWDSTTFEPNNWLANAYRINLGREKALKTQIEPRNNTYSTNAADKDWFQFEAVAGRTYVIELFDIVSNFALVSGSDCGSYKYAGIWLAVYDPSLHQVVRQCQPVGRGDVHTSVQLTAGVSGIFYIEVAPHEATVSGSYHIRVLPQFDEPQASWDKTTFEPNNQLANAYQIKIGRENALTSTIEQRNKTYATNFADADVYRFEAVAGQTYLVELFNIDNTLELATGSDCGSYRYAGLWFAIFNQTGHEVIRQCQPEGIRDVHASVEFTAGVNGTFYIWVAPHEASVSGNYSIRVLPQASE